MTFKSTIIILIALYFDMEINFWHFWNYEVTQNRLAHTPLHQNSVIMVKNSIITLLMLTLVALLTTCSRAEPKLEDMKRVRRNYLDLRFQRPFSAQLESADDKKLLELSCIQNQVQCSGILELLKEHDPDFYKKFQDLKPVP